jgi:hypothetical protein
VPIRAGARKARILVQTAPLLRPPLPGLEATHGIRLRESPDCRSSRIRLLSSRYCNNTRIRPAQIAPLNGRRRALIESPASEPA